MDMQSTGGQNANVGNKGLFIVFEGGEGSGKSTQAGMLADALIQHNIPTLLTREPGDSSLGRRLREILLDPNTEPMSRKAEMLLFAADRAEHVEKVILPALRNGDVVVCDRYMASTMAYQAHAGELDEIPVELISDWASGGLNADLTYFLDVDPEVGLERAKKVARTRFEEKSLTYHETVRRSFIGQRNDSWLTVSAEDNVKKTVEQIHNEILDHTLHVLRVIDSFMKGRAVTKPALTTEQDLYRDAVKAMRMYQAPITTCGREGCIDHPAKAAS